MYILVQCYCGISLPLIPITRLPLAMTRHTRTTKHAQGLLYFTNYHIHNYEGFNRMFNGWKQALRAGIYRSKERCTWTESTNETSLTKDTVKRQGPIMEDSGKREQYSKTSIFGRICQHCTTREQATLTLNHHHTTIPDKQQTTREYVKTMHPSSFWIIEHFVAWPEVFVVMNMIVCEVEQPPGVFCSSYISGCS